MMNKVFLIGRLTKDPELRYTGSNKAVCQITVAVNRGFGNQNGNAETDFINVVLWDKTAENVAKYMTKGRLLLVEGRIQTRNYDNNEGKKVYVTEVVASNVQFLESKIVKVVVAIITTTMLMKIHLIIIIPTVIKYLKWKL